MPNYDIIPLATDLLDYTIQRVKVKEPQYTKVKAYVMENGQMVEKELFEKIKDDGKPHFPKSQTFHMCADMQRMASAILQKCNSADGRYFETEYEERLKDLDEVIVLCDTLNQYINLSYKRKYISGDQCPQPLKGYTSRELLYLGMTYFSTVLPEHEQHQQRRLLEHQWQCQQQQLHQHQRVPPRSDGKA